MNIVLASSSPYRRALLKRLHIDFQHQSPSIDETPRTKESGQALVERLAKQKAQAVMASVAPKTLIIASDQVGVDESGHILSKPGSHAAARAQLTSLSEQTVTFYTSLFVGNQEQHYLDVVSFCVGFRKLTDDEIARYVAIEQPLDCAGSFKAEALGSSLFSFQRGDDPTSLIGLPLIQLSERLRQFGLQCP